MEDTISPARTLNELERVRDRLRTLLSGPLGDQMVRLEIQGACLRICGIIRLLELKSQ